MLQVAGAQRRQARVSWRHQAATRRLVARVCRIILLLWLRRRRLDVVRGVARRGIGYNLQGEKHKPSVNARYQAFINYSTAAHANGRRLPNPSAAATELCIATIITCSSNAGALLELMAKLMAKRLLERLMAGKYIIYQ